MRIKDRVKPKAPPVAPGVYMAICVGVIDLGEQYSDRFKSYSNKVLFVFELCGEHITVDGKQQPRQLSREFTISASKKGALRPFLENWNGESYSDDAFGELDLFAQIGKPCQIQVALNETKEYANVTNVMQVPKGYTPPEAESTPFLWDMEDWNEQAFQDLPAWAKEKIQKSTQYQKDHVPTDAVTVSPAGGEKEANPI